MQGKEAFSSAGKRWEKFESSTGPALASFILLAKQMSKSDTLDAATKRDYLTQVQQNVHDLVRLEAIASERGRACGRVSEQCAHDVDVDILDMYAEEMEKANNAASRINVERNEEAEEVANLLRERDDDDLAVEESGSRFVAKCPILSTPLTNPMRNEKCNHVYSMTGAFQLLLTKLDGRIRPKPTELAQLPTTVRHACPIAGCPHQFGPDTIKRDYAAELSQRMRSETAGTEDADGGDAIDMCE